MSLIVDTRDELIEINPGWTSMLIEIIEINKQATEINKMLLEALTTNPRFIIRSERDGLATKEEIRNKLETQ